MQTSARSRQRTAAGDDVCASSSRRSRACTPSRGMALSSRPGTTCRAAHVQHMPALRSKHTPSCSAPPLASFVTWRPRGADRARERTAAAPTWDKQTCVAPLGSTQMNLVLSRILRKDDAFAGLTLRSRRPKHLGAGVPCHMSRQPSKPAVQMCRASAPICED